MSQCYAYVRVSTAKQGEGASLEAQQEAINYYAEKHDIKIVKWFEEKETAAKSGRPIFNKMIGDLKRRRADGLVIHKIDRSARNFADWAKIGDLSDAGVHIHFATESLDFNSRGGRLTADIQAVIAADYIRNLREEAKKGLDMRLKQGLYPFKAPIGYVDNGKGKAKTICPLRGSLVRTMFELYASGNYSLWTLPEEMTRRGLTTSTGGVMRKSNIEKALRNPFYMGLILIQTTGKTYQGIHEPLISAELFETVTAIRSVRDNKKSTKHNHRFGGLFQCGYCSKAMIPELQKGTVYYRCHQSQCQTKSVREDALQKAVLNLLKPCVLSSEAHKKLVEGFEGIRSQIKDNPLFVVADREVEKINARLNVLTDKLLDDVIDDETFKRKERQLFMDQKRWQERKERAHKQLQKIDYIDAFLLKVKNLYFTFNTATSERQREVVKMATSNRIVRGKNIYLEPQKWLLALSNLEGVSQCAHSITSSRTFEDVMNFIEEPHA